MIYVVVKYQLVYIYDLRCGKVPVSIYMIYVVVKYQLVYIYIYDFQYHILYIYYWNGCKWCITIKVYFQVDRDKNLDCYCIHSNTFNSL